MQLKIILPTKILMEERVEKIIAEDARGSFCVFSKHIDFTTALEAGIFIYKTEAGIEEYLALDEGILVKCSAEVTVVAKRAFKSADLSGLRRTVEEQFKSLDEHESRAYSVLVGLQTDFIRKYTEEKKYER